MPSIYDDEPIDFSVPPREEAIDFSGPPPATKRPSIFDDAGPATAPATPSITAKLLDWVKQGMADSANLYTTIGAMGSPEATTQMMGQGQDPMTEAQAVGATNKAAAESALGVQGLKPNSPAEQVLKAGASSVGDPLTYVGGSGLVGSGLRASGGLVAKMFPEFVGRAVAPVGGLAAEVTGRAVAGATAAGTGEYSRYAVERAGAGPFGQFVASLVGGAGPGVITGVTGQAVRGVRDSAVAAKALPGTLGARLEGQAGMKADQDLRLLVAAMMESDPGMVPHLDRAIDDSRRINAALPIGQQLPENVVVRAAVLQSMHNSPQFRAAYGLQLKQAQEGLDAYRHGLFGKPADAGAALSRTTPEKVAQLERVQAQVDESFNTAMEKATRDVSLNPDKADLGDRLQTVIDFRRKWAMHRFGPEIDKAVAAGEKAGAKPQQGHIANLVEDTTALQDRQFMSAAPASVRRAVERSMKGLAGDQPVSLRDLMTMDQAVSKALRETPTTSPQYLKLRNLQHSIDDAIAGSGDAFSAPYRVAKEAYKQAVAIPFLQPEAIKSMTRAKFSENVVPMLLRKSAMEDFLAAGGDDAAALGKEALLSNLYDRAIKPTGKLDPEAARRWLDTHKDVVALVPGLSKQLGDATGAARLAVENRQAVTRRLSETIKTKIYSAEGKGEGQLANELLTNSTNVDKALNTYGRNPEGLQALRSVVLDKLMREGDPLEALARPEYENSVRRLYGPDYVNQVKDAVRLQSAANRAKADSVPYSLDRGPGLDPLEKAVGARFSIPYVAGILRNQVMSNPAKGMNIVSRAVQSRSAKMLDEKIAQMMLEPDILTAHVKALREAGVGTHAGATRTPKEYLNAFLNNPAVRGRWADLQEALVRDMARGAALGGSHSAGADERPEVVFPRTIWTPADPAKPQRDAQVPQGRSAAPPGWPGTIWDGVHGGGR